MACERRRNVGRPSNDNDYSIFKKHPRIVEAGAGPSLRSEDEKVRAEAKTKSMKEREMFVGLGNSYLQDCQTVWGRFETWTKHQGIPPEANRDNVNRFLDHQAHHPDGVVQKCKGLHVSLFPFS